MISRLNYLTALVLALSLSWTACRSAPPPAELLSVVERLGPRSFGQGKAPARPPMASIGDEARPVIADTAPVLIAEKLGVPVVDGVARAEIDLDQAARDLPRSALVLTVQEFPFAAELAPEVMADIAHSTFAKKVDTRWQLEPNPDDPGRATLEYRPTQPRPSMQVTLRLAALAASPQKLASRAFKAPAGARLELGFGLINPPSADAPASAHFAARLACNSQPSIALVDTIVDAASADASRWHDVTAGLPARGGSCRLTLSAETGNGAPVRGAVWAVPRVLAPRVAKDPAAPRGLVLVSLDTLRADHLSGFGYARSTSPTIDRELIRAGTSFTDVMATFPQTDVSHLSLFTGLYPAAQPLRGRLAREAPVVTLAELLAGAGFETVAFTEDALLSGSFGFWLGFDRFIERSVTERDRGTYSFADAVKALGAERDRRFFVFVHTYKTHDPYVVSAPYEGLFRGPDEWSNGGPNPLVPPRHRDKVDAYDRTIREADDLVGKLLAALTSNGLDDDTLVVLLSDHGEAFGEHGATGHGFAAHQEQLHIPLILRGPGIPSERRIDRPASMVDVTPTLLDLLGLPPAPQGQGTSLRAALTGAPTPLPDRPLYFSWLRKDAIGVRHGNWKFLSTADGHELFDLAQDPAERAPQGRSEPPRVVDEELLREHAETSTGLRDRFAATAGKPGAAPAISERAEGALRALGYIE